MKVFVYYNLHKHKWSIKSLEGEKKGKVIGHAEMVLLENVTPKVSEAGRQRVLREQRKNVHAGLVGILSGVSSESSLCVSNDGVLADIENLSYDNGCYITYNPYKYDSFVVVNGSAFFPPNKFVRSNYAMAMRERKVCVFGATVS